MSSVCAVGLVAALAAPREAKAAGFFTDNTTTTLPLLQACQDTKAGCYTSWLTLADLDGDGDMDIIEANGGGYYTPYNTDESAIYFNDGKGVFTDVTPTKFNNAYNRNRQVAVADIDGDGDLDVYQPGGYGYDKDKLFVQTAPGVFTDMADTLLPAGLMSHAASTHMGDLDGDGDADLIVMDWTYGSTNTISRAIMYTNDGKGKFTLAAMQNDPGFASPTDRLPPTIPAAGVNPPIPATAGLNTGSATYWGVRPIDVDFADVDNDFDIDILVNHRNGYSRIFINDGHGNFSDGTNFKLTTSADGSKQTVTTNYPSKQGPYVYNQEVCDIDDDGDLDMLIDNAGPKPANNVSWAFSGGGTVDVSQILINDGHGKFVDDTANRVIGEPGGDDNALKCADLNNDGHYDLIVATLSGRSEKLLVNDGAGHFNFVPDGIPYVPGDSSLSLDVADLNGDKMLDLVTGQGEGGGSYIDRVYLGGGANQVDNRPPVFRAIQVPSPLAETPTVIRFAVRDSATNEAGQMVKSAAVNYSVAGGALKTIKAAFYGGDLFRASIPAQPAGSVVTFSVTATDRFNNVGTSSSTTFTVPVPDTTIPSFGGAGGMGGGGAQAGAGGMAAGGTGGSVAGGGSTIGEAGSGEAGSGDAGAPAETGGASGGSAGKGGSGASGKAGAATTSGGETGAEAGDTSSGGATGTHSVATDDGGCTISIPVQGSKGRGAAVFGLGLAMLGLSRRRRNRK